MKEPAGWVPCPEKITGPHASQEYPGLLRDNEPCPEHVAVYKSADAMHCRCPRGHTFIASRSQITTLPPYLWPILPSQPSA